MATWDPPSDAELDVDKPIKAVDIRRIRDLSEAMAEGAAGAPIAGGLIPLAVAVISNDAVIDFTEFDAAKYDSYVFEFHNVEPVADDDILRVRTSTNGGSSFDTGASDYGWVTHGYFGPAGIVVGRNAGDTSITISAITTGEGVGNEASEYGFSGRLHVYKPSETNWTHISHTAGYQMASVGGEIAVIHGASMRRSAADVDAIRFFYLGGNTQSGTITMYGVVAP